MPKIVNIAGKVFGKLKVIARNPENNKWGQSRWDCQCDCGNVSTKDYNHLVSGRTKSCGLCPTATVDIAGNRYGKLIVKCLHSERTDDGRVRWVCACDCGGEKITRGDHLKDGLVTSCGCVLEYHGMSHSLEYKVWDAMRQRCSNPKNSHYDNYGGRGITVCDEWMQSFEAFYRDMGPRPSPRHTIDREDNDGNYEPGNCRWITQKEQTNNTRRNLNFTYKGETKTLKEWSETLGFNYHNVKYRIHNGMLFEVAIEIDTITKDGLLTLNGVTKTILQWCTERLVTFVLFRQRVNGGWTFEESLTPIGSSRIRFDGEEKSLAEWCDMLGLDEQVVCLRILRGESFEDISKE